MPGEKPTGLPTGLEPLKDDEADGDERDLWFLPGPETDLDAPPGVSPQQRPDLQFGAQPWRDAQCLHAVGLARTASLLGALDERLRRGPVGWRQRLALLEVSDLSWWSGDRLAAERIALWVGLRIGATEDEGPALARAAWAVRHLSSGSAPYADPAGFLEWRPGLAGQGVEDGRIASDTVRDLVEIMADEDGLHPITAAARLFHIWRATRFSPASDIEGAVLAARHAGRTPRGSESGALFLPIALAGAIALRGQGPADVRLEAWYRGTERSTLAALLHLDRLSDWRARAAEVTRDLTGRTPAALMALLEAWPTVTAPFAQAQTGASRAAIQRNLLRFADRGLVAEITGQTRFRVWTARL
jgi:hypothetical protein